jgi:hypothetical protein
MPLDAGLVIDFHVHDPFRLLPEQHAVKHTLLTPPGGGELIDIVAGIGDVASEVKRFPTGAGEIEVEPPGDPMAAPGQPAQMPGMKIHVERKDHLKPIDTVKIADPNLRGKTASDAGLFQLVKLKVTMGDWTGIVYAQFTEEAGERLAQDQWHGGFVLPPGAITPLQVQLGSTRRPLPARLTLDQLKLTAEEDAVSTITLSRTDSDLDSFTDAAKLNHPIYFGNGNWIFSQAGYDSVGRQWTELRIGNRPAVNVMLAGCVMIFLGFAYTVFAKPIIVRKMKQKAKVEEVVNH